jgi:hypothetical protein
MNESAHFSQQAPIFYKKTPKKGYAAIISNLKLAAPISIISMICKQNKFTKNGINWSN